MVVGGEHAVPEGRLVEPLLDQAEGASSPKAIRASRGEGSSLRRRSG
jgi:hypothetical protein